MDTTTLVAEKPAATAAGAFVLGGFLAAILTLSLVFGILTIIAGWRILKKAGEPGWKILIPFYNTYVLLKIVRLKTWFWFMLALNVLCIVAFIVCKFDVYLLLTGTSEQIEGYLYGYDFAQNPMVIVAIVLACIYSIILTILYSYRLAKVFGHGIGFTLGNIFFPTIFWLILGFGKSKYNKKNLKA